MIDIRFIPSVTDISSAELNCLVGNYPFLSYEFLSLLESSGVVGKGTGWHVSHCVCFQGDRLIAFLPLFFKYHSYGEYVFDQTWAEAYYRYGFDYYPKLVSSVPFTPITGPRFCCALPEDQWQSLHYEVVQAIKSLAVQNEASSYHLLFPTQSEMEKSISTFDFSRRAVHFQWFNRDYQSFDDFLAQFSSRKRKNVKKERKALVDKQIEFELLSGDQVQPGHWDAFYKFYVITYAKRSGHGGYLNKAFFTSLSETMANQIVLVMAKRDGKYIAGALNFKDGEKLYGRYWGAIEHHEFLHFETCYYQGIEYCIEHGLEGFDPGVQGEHKIQRGFEPVFTYSGHWIRDEAFRIAIEKAVVEEGSYIQAYFDETSDAVPFKKPQG
ncbi:GNAT family N-acetyltransferase [Litoribrevibacter euphylliae]|uniref:GNAT family N-acetyltransferase n=1 Tax=Litoribrevibacter euphylliae TaxID=1834034 RepID=A0ABV7HKU1_9GAMM